MSFEIKDMVAIGAIALTAGGILLTIGRLLERQKVHSETLDVHEGRIGGLEEAHTGQSVAFEALKGEIMSLKTTMESLGHTLERWIERVDKRLDKS